mmetsp:Transcript_4732/g.14042  ORF Transcript_4732/g.14042 Transcript_4732/m.14042 type:complete len:414 (-) Transcript_4732:58-1299(-)
MIVKPESMTKVKEAVEAIKTNGCADTPSKDAEVTIRPYGPGDDAALTSLERHAMQGPKWLQRLCLVEFCHHGAFDRKPRQFDAHVALVAEGPAGVVGVVCAGVKRGLRLPGAARTGAYVFGLRVDEQWQRRGIASRLSAAVEAACLERFGVDYFYLSVNGSNAVARGFYESRGYALASVRKPVVTILRAPRAASPRVRRLDAAETAELWETELGAEDHFLGDVRAIVDSPHFLGAYEARDARGRAVLGLWDGSALSSVSVPEILGLPTRAYRSAAVRILLGTTAAAVACAAAPRYPRWSACAAAALALAYRQLRPWFFALRHLEAADPKMRARAFAPVVSGEGEGLLAELYAHLHNVARDLGFATLVVNVDERDPKREVFGREAFTTHFLHKQTRGAAPPLLSPANFFDPRDI